MKNDYTEVNVQKEKMDVSIEPEQVPGPMPVDDSVAVEKPKRRRRSSWKGRRRVVRNKTREENAQ